jgi:hypothetical protein
MNKLILFFAVSISLTLASCAGKSKKEGQVRKNVESLMMKDLGTGVRAGVDMATAGIASTLLNVVLDKDKQDSLIAAPIMKYVKQDIEKAEIRDLKPLEKDSKARYLFIGKSLVNHKNEIHHEVQQKLGVDSEIVDDIIKFCNEKSSN